MNSQMHVELSAVNNPDFENDNRAIPKVNVPITSIDESPGICRSFIEAAGLGGGNWSGGNVMKNGIKVAYVSYNGRVWDAEGNEIK